VFNETKPLFSGCATALVTPFLPDGTVDQHALIQLIQIQMNAGIDALVLLGTTGEPCTLSMKERELVIATGMETVRGRIPLIVGTGTNDTRRAIEYAKQAKDFGVQGQLCVTPYYNKTTQAGLIRHYNAILSACDLPMILYHVPSRTGMNLAAETIIELALHPLILGVKDASGNLSLSATIIEQTNGQLPIYCGNHDLIVPMMALGAKGAISVCSNVIPSQTLDMIKACLCGRFDDAAELQRAWLPFINALFSQVNPIPVKAALSMVGLIHEELRLPLVPLDEPHRSRLKNLLQKHQLIP